MTKETDPLKVDQNLTLPAPARISAFYIDIDSYLAYFAEDYQQTVRSGHSSQATLLSGRSETLCRTPSIESLKDPETQFLPPRKDGNPYRHPQCLNFTAYHRLFSTVFLGNVIIAVAALSKNEYLSIDTDTLSTVASSNILLAVLIRQDFCVNILYRTSWLVPWKTPLWLRRQVAKIYTYGGVHSGSAFAGTLWFLAFAIVATWKFARWGISSAGALTLSWAIEILLVLITLFSAPTIRFRYHNVFELTHRFLGWAALVLFWTLLFLLSLEESQASNETTISVLARKPASWNLAVTSLLVIVPWLCLRRWEFNPEKLSNHALRLHFEHKVSHFSCLSISTSPLFEWHPFATFPAPRGQKGASVVISDAGDWTHQQIQKPRTTYWVKGFTRPGVLSMGCIFRRVIIITTGSGIGPCLHYLADRPSDQFCRLVWSAPAPIETFGKAINDWVHDLNPESLIIDTKVSGRQDLTRIAYQQYIACDAEAVFVLSNAILTSQLVHNLKSRGVPAYGPIWDS